MAQPFDYISPFQQDGGADSTLRAMQMGTQAGVLEQQRALFEAQRTAAEQKALRDQQEADAAAERQRQINEKISGLMAKDPASRTFADYESVAVLLPQKEADSLRANWKELGSDRQANMLDFGGRVLAAFQSKSPEIGIQMLRERAVAERNAGREDQAKGYETWASMAEIDPDSVSVSIGTLIAQVPGGDKVIEGISKLEQTRQSKAKAPFELEEAKGKASKAAVDAKFAEDNAALDLKQKGWNIKKLQNDIEISRQNARIAAMNAGIAREANELKRQELIDKRDEALGKREQTVRERAADLESARSNIDNMLNTATRILNTEKGVIRAATGPIAEKIPTVRESTADFEELVKTLGSQAFLAQIPNIKGMGALSNAEGEKLTAALQNFSIRQSPERLVENVREATRLLQKARANIASRYGVPETPADIPAAASAGAPSAGAPAESARGAPPMPAGFRVIR